MVYKVQVNDNKYNFRQNLIINGPGPIPIIESHAAHVGSHMTISCKSMLRGRGTQQFNRKISFFFSSFFYNMKCIGNMGFSIFAWVIYFFFFPISIGKVPGVWMCWSSRRCADETSALSWIFQVLLAGPFGPRSKFYFASRSKIYYLFYFLYTKLNTCSFFLLDFFLIFILFEY